MGDGQLWSQLSNFTGYRVSCIYALDGICIGYDITVDCNFTNADNDGISVDGNFTDADHDGITVDHNFTDADLESITVDGNFTIWYWIALLMELH